MYSVETFIDSRVDDRYIDAKFFCRFKEPEIIMGAPLSHAN